ncbi:MAG: methyl-accepting chemotaxis protein [Polyangiaceae bacterium]|nr:methyl-accepting chemotaxis protein [Polyangiaceae bacterium]
MAGSWTFGRKVGFGFAVAIVLTLLIGGVATYALRAVVAGKDRVITVDAAHGLAVERLATSVARRQASMRAYLLTKEESRLVEIQERRQEFEGIVAELRRDLTDAELRRLLDDVDHKEVAYSSPSDKAVAGRKAGADLPALIQEFDENVEPAALVLRQSIDALREASQRVLERNTQAASDAASSAISLVLSIAVAAVILAIFAGILLTRTLGKQISTAVNQVQSSSAELQAAANQQATGVKEQATAMSEIATTITELLATSRQIAESAQRVAKIAEQTASAAKNGDGTVDRGNDAVAGIRRQVDLIVSHMLELGRKSQQIGAVLEIVGELAEQTNILAINATIEAAGAGEQGKRFSVVADEIRKLADRVGGSTKEIRSLIDDVRSAVNTTVMTTETGSKAVEAGAKQFTDVATAFSQIASLVATTTDAAREIELSTKQQSSAVEQVNVAILNVAQATRENEASTSQTLQTASQLTGLARELLRLVEPQSTRVNGAGAGHA